MHGFCLLAILSTEAHPNHFRNIFSLNLDGAEQVHIGENYPTTYGGWYFQTLMLSLKYKKKLTLIVEI